MINFACKDFRSIDIIKCGLGLTRAELSIFLHLLKNKDRTFTTSALSKEVGLEITTAQKAFKKMTEKKLLTKNQLNLDTGGYLFEYKILPENKIKQILKDIIKSWSKRVEKKIDQDNFFKI